MRWAAWFYPAVWGWSFGRHWQQFPNQAASERPVGHPVTYGADLGEGPGPAPSNGFGNRDLSPWDLSPTGWRVSHDSHKLEGSPSHNRSREKNVTTSHFPSRHFPLSYENMPNRWNQ